MALYVGETVRVRAHALDPETGERLDPAPTEAFVDFWAPEVERGDAPTLGNRQMAYREATNDFVLNETTNPNSGWVPGKWTYRVTVVGQVFTNWEYGSFKLSA